MQTIKRNDMLPRTDADPAVGRTLASPSEVSANPIGPLMQREVWHQAMDPETGLPYYYCVALNISQWEPPACGYVPLPLLPHVNMPLPFSGKQFSLNEMHRTIDEKDEDPESRTALEQQTPYLVTQRMCTTGLLPEMPLRPIATHTRFLEDGTAEISSEAKEALVLPVYEDLERMEQIESSFYDTSSKQLSNKVPPRLFKYWLQRYSLFSRYDQGIAMDYDSWFSVTPEVIAWHQAKRARRCFDQSCVVVDAFAGAGGNAIQFALAGCHVIAIEIDSRRASYLAQNAAVYGVADRIEIVCGDFLKLTKSIVADVAFFSPPWGGPDYCRNGNYDVESMGGQEAQYGLRNLLNKVFYDMHCSAAIFWLPRNSSLSQLDNARCILPSEYDFFPCEVEYTELNGIRKGLTAYYGKIAKCSGQRNRSSFFK